MHLCNEFPIHLKEIQYADLSYYWRCYISVSAKCEEVVSHHDLSYKRDCNISVITELEDAVVVFANLDFAKHYRFYPYLSRTNLYIL